MSGQKAKSFGITVRPLLGLTERTEEAIIQWIDKKCSYGAVYIEKENEERHAHIQIWLDEPRCKGDVFKSIKNICEKTITDWDAKQKKVLSRGVKFCYNDWLLLYCEDNENKTNEKGDKIEYGKLVYSDEPTNSEEYYPSEEEQAKIEEKANCKNSMLERYKNYWIEEHGDKLPSSPELLGLIEVSALMTKLQYCKKVECVMLDKKYALQFRNGLYHYIIGRENKFIYMSKDETEKYTQYLNDKEKGDEAYAISALL